MSRFRRKSLRVAAVYLLFFICFLEASARLAFHLPAVAWRLNSADEDYSWHRQWVQRHQQYGMSAYYTFDQYDSTKGWALKPNLSQITVFQNKILNSNSRGIRSNREFPYPRTQNTPRIVILGDSFTFGDEVSDDETYSYFLQKMLPQAEVINMGMHGYGHDQMLIWLKEEGVRYSPDIVIIGFLPLDMSRNLLTFRDFAKPRYVARNGQFQLIGSPVAKPEDVLRTDWIRPRILDLFSLLRFRIQILSGQYEKEELETTNGIITAMLTTIESIHATPLLVYLPQGEEVSGQPGYVSREKYMFTFCERDPRAKCFSAKPHFAQKMAAGEIPKVAGHWDAAGHHTVAEAIRNYLVDQSLIAAP